MGGTYPAAALARCLIASNSASVFVHFGIGISMLEGTGGFGFESIVPTGCFDCNDCFGGNAFLTIVFCAGRGIYDDGFATTDFGVANESFAVVAGIVVGRIANRCIGIFTFGVVNLEGGMALFTFCALALPTADGTGLLAETGGFPDSCGFAIFG